MQMDSAVDARSDVLLAAEGAARLLADNYRRVLSWPLALTGYNHGIAGLERAVRQVGSSSIVAIVENYQSRTFGFASRNFYAEFVAAATVFADRAKFFPGVEPLQAVEFEAFTPGRFVSMLDLSSLTGTSVDALVTLNPALHEDVSLGTLLIPPQYPLRVPPGRLAEFGRAFQRLPDSRKRDRQITATYRVASGDNLGAIARRFGTSTTALQRANNLPRADRIYINQVLEIPNGGGTWSPLVWSPGAAPVEGAQVHVVQRGETLAAIGSRYGQSVQALVAANNISSPNRIQVGARITIPGSTLLDGPTVHIVQHGDTVTQIARRYGRSVQALITANNLTAPDSLRVGARLSIPAAE
jgi:membrane-bound lytic murein transglycosylase D